MTQFNTLLYFETSCAMTHQLNIQFKHFNLHSSLTMTAFLTSLLQNHHKHYSTQLKLSSEMLNIGQFIPIFITPELILCPLFAKRSTYQVYINMTQVIGMSSIQERTRIIFNNNQHLVVEQSITFCSKKWKESLFLGQLILSQSI
ncbi:comK family protein [Staphylococcus agnetis]|nr:comK family protein [Staphylococcus agnetis]